MKIEATMSLSELAQYLGHSADYKDAELVRSFLVNRFDGMDTADIVESQFWQAVIDALKSMKGEA